MNDFYIMREDNIVGQVKDNEIVSLESLAPMFLKTTQDFETWLCDRCADLSRSNMRIILRSMSLPVTSARSAVMFVNAVSITDSFWVKPTDSNLSYKDVAFKNDKYFKAALVGDPDVFSFQMETSPEITNIGSFNKGWKLINGEWYLYKSGTQFQIFSELFTANLGLELGLDMVEYFSEDGFIVCKSFVEDGWCFEPAKSVIGQNSSDYIECCVKMQSLGLLKPYLDIIFLDAIVRNADRHEFNFGFLTSENNITLAPNFDNNLSLFHSGLPTVFSRQDVLVKDFLEGLKFVKNTYGISYTLPPVDEKIIEKAYLKIQDRYKIGIPLSAVSEFCISAYNCLHC